MKPWSTRQKRIAGGIGLGVLAALVLSQSLFVHAMSYVTGPFTLTPLAPYSTGSLTGSTHTTLSNLEQAYNLGAYLGATSNNDHNAQLWEFNEYPAYASTNVTSNLGYLFIEQDQLQIDSANGGTQATNLFPVSAGGYGNPKFAESMLFNGSHIWNLTTDTVTGSYGSAINPKPYTTDWYNLPDVLNINGMYINESFNGPTGQSVWQPQTSLKIANVPIATMTNLNVSTSFGGVSTTSLTTNQSAFINMALSGNLNGVYGSNVGDYVTTNYMAAYWVPTSNTSSATYALVNQSGTSSAGFSLCSRSRKLSEQGERVG